MNDPVKIVDRTFMNGVSYPRDFQWIAFDRVSSAGTHPLIGSFLSFDGSPDESGPSR